MNKGRRVPFSKRKTTIQQQPGGGDGPGWGGGVKWERGFPLAFPSFCLPLWAGERRAGVLVGGGGGKEGKGQKAEKLGRAASLRTGRDSQGGATETSESFSSSEGKEFPGPERERSLTALLTQSSVRERVGANPPRLRRRRRFEGPVRSAGWT